MVKRTPLNITLYVYCLSGHALLLLRVVKIMASGGLDGSEMAMDEDDKTFFLSLFLSFLV